MVNCKKLVLTIAVFLGVQAGKIQDCASEIWKASNKIELELELQHLVDTDKQIPDSVNSPIWKALKTCIGLDAKAVSEALEDKERQKEIYDIFVEKKAISTYTKIFRRYYRINRGVVTDKKVDLCGALEQLPHPITGCTVDNITNDIKNWEVRKTYHQDTWGWKDDEKTVLNSGYANDKEMESLSHVFPCWTALTEAVLKSDQVNDKLQSKYPECKELDPSNFQKLETQLTDRLLCLSKLTGLYEAEPKDYSQADEVGKNCKEIDEVRFQKLMYKVKAGKCIKALKDGYKESEKTIDKAEKKTTAECKLLSDDEFDHAKKEVKMEWDNEDKACQSAIVEKYNAKTVTKVTLQQMKDSKKCLKVPDDRFAKIKKLAKEQLEKDENRKNIEACMQALLNDYDSKSINDLDKKHRGPAECAKNLVSDSQFEDDVLEPVRTALEAREAAKARREAANARRNKMILIAFVVLIIVTALIVVLCCCCCRKSPEKFEDNASESTEGSAESEEYVAEEAGSAPK